MRRTVGNTQKTHRNIMNGYLYDLRHYLKNRQKSYSFAAHFEKHFNDSISCTDLRKHIKFRVVKHLNSIGAIKRLRNPTKTYLWSNI